MKTNIKSLYLIIILIVGLLSACQEDTYIETIEVKAPTITSFSPNSGEVGSVITITGENLQKVDTVLVGGGLAEIKYRISSTKLVAKVVSTCRDGKVVVSNSKGKSESTNEFTVTYLTPYIAPENYPTSGTVNEEVVIEGEYLNVIDSILVGGEKVTIISQRANEIVFKVPYAEDETPVTLRYAYFNGTENVLVGPEGSTFTILKEAPSVSYCPTSLTKYTPVTIQGERLTLIDSIFVGSVKMLIKLKTDTEITIDMPTDYFGGNMSGALTGIYYGARQIVLTDDFQVTADPNEPRYYSYTDVLLSARIAYGGTEDAFFDAETGTVFNSCSAYENRSVIDFYLYDQSGYVQLYGPHNGSSTIKNFKCNGVSIDPKDGSWDDFYGTGGIQTKFRVLSRDSTNHLAVLDAFDAGTIVELNDDFFTGISLPSTSSPRIYKSVDDAGYNVASGHFCIDKNNIGWVRNYTTGKNGIIKITGMPKEAVNNRIPELTFDIIWQK
ncbi:MAG: IPT/TIG domain-containing protein [Paludibacter sp.]|nr:IPT/TIG domain-containing protein [Paludibacter sp.]